MKTKLKYILIVILSILLWSTLTAQTTNFVVTNVNNSGTGSLRQAVINAMAVNAATTITFRVPAASGNVINLTSEIPMRGVYRTMTINGYNVSTGTNNIILRGSGTQSIHCFNDSTVNLTVYGLQFENFNYAIRAFGNNTYSTNTIIGGTGTNANVFIKNYIAIGTNGGTTITGNYIGTDKNFTAGVGNNYGIYATTPYYSDYNGNPITINNNYICSAYIGVYVNPPTGNNPNPLLLMNNNIVGTNNAAATRTDLTNTYSIYNTASTANAFLQGNTIAYTTNTLGMLLGGFEFLNNSFYCNAKPITNLKDPYPQPIISQITPNQNGTVTITGTSNKPNDIINIFQKDSSVCTTLPCQGFFAGATSTNDNGQWTITLTLKSGKIITANATSRGTTYTPIGRIAAYSIGSSSLFTKCYTIPCPTVNVSFATTKNNLCYGNSEGTAQLTINPVGSGGTYSYQIINTSSNTIIAKGAITTTTTIGQLPAGTYQAVIINNATGCNYPSSIIKVTQPTAPLSITSCKETIPVSSTTSADAVAQVIVSGGTSPYSLTITRPTGATFTLGPQTSGTFNISNLAPGNYNVIAFDANYANGNPRTSCTATCVFTINTANCSALKMNVKTTNNVLCNGSTTGSLVIKYTDLANNLPLTLTANNGFSQTITAFSSDSTAIVPILKAGAYTLTLRNKLNCITTTSATITEPPVLTVICDSVINAKRVGEASGQAVVTTLRGGTAAYTLVISGPINRNYSDSTPRSFTIDSLKNGVYIATVYDRYQCFDTCQFTINEPTCTGFAVRATTDSIRCFGEKNGRITLTTVNGVSSYTYAWSNATIGNQAIAHDLDIGAYKATVTDDRNCKDSITATISTPSVLITNINKTDVAAVGGSNGSINVTVSGGTPSYFVELTLNNTSIPLTTQTNNTFIFNNLSKGTYIALTTDAYGCSKTDTIRINDPNCNFIINAQADSVSCYGDNNGRISITHNAIGIGVNYVWSQANIGNTATATALQSGIYSVTATTIQNCSDTLSIEVFQPDSLAASAFVNDVTVVGGSNGSININVMGGTQPYTVLRGNTAATRLNSRTFEFNNLPKGIYTFTVTDAKGCFQSQTVIVGSPNCNMTLSAQVLNVLCKSAATGRITLTVNNNVGTPTFAWTPPSVSNSNIANNLTAGAYVVKVTDSRLCTIDTIIRVSEPNLALSSIGSASSVSTIGGNDGKIDITVRGGTPPYTVVRGTTPATRINDSTFVFNGLSSGNYTYTVTDANGCTTSQTVTVGSPNCNITIDISITQAISCFGASDGRLNVVVQNAQTPQYIWQPSVGNTPNPSNLSAGKYVVTVTDARNCTAIDSIILTERLQIKASMSGDTALCAGQSTKLRFTIQNTNDFILTFTDGQDTFRSTTLETTVAPTISTTYRLTHVQSGTCPGIVLDNNSANINVRTPSVPTGLKAEKDSLCSGSDIRLSVIATNTNQYIWQTPLGERTTTSPQLIIANATTANSGNYSIKTRQNGCLSAATTPIAVHVVGLSNEKANAGIDKTECDQTVSTLNATPIVAENITGRWVAVGAGILATPTKNNTTVSNLAIGTNAFVWILSNNICGEVSRDTVVISLSAKPELAATSQINLDSKLSTVLINTRELLKNKFLDPSVFSVKILKFPDKTTVETRSNGIFFDRNDLFEAQTIDIEFEICAKICPSVCTKGKITMVLQDLKDDTDLSVPKVFAVNNSSGSSLDINGLDFFLDNEITIVNRWGQTVFGPKVYKNNAPEKSWDGRKNGKPVPSGAYYYFIRYKNKDVLKMKKGIIYLVETL